MSERVRIALQKNGRLAEDSVTLLKNCGLHVTRSKDQLFCRIKELPVDLLLVRDDDIPSFVNKEICDLGIVGEDTFAETKLGTENFTAVVVERLGFSGCRLTIAVPEESQMKSIADLAGATIATSYPLLLEKFLKEQQIAARPLIMTGSVEVAPRLKIADAICDIVASGATLTANNLRELHVVLKSEALLIRGAKPFSDEKTAILQRLLARIRGAVRADDSKYIMMNAPRSAINRIVALLPGSDSPTIMDLNNHDMVAIHAVCRESVFWETMEKLQAEGARSILVLPIEKMMA